MVLRRFSEDLADDFHMFFGGTGMVDDDFLGPLTDGSCQGWVAQKSLENGGQVSGAIYLKSGIGVKQGLAWLSEVEGVWPEDGGFSQSSRGHHIGTAQRCQGSSDKDDSGEAVEFVQVAHGISQDDGIAGQGSDGVEQSEAHDPGAFGGLL